VSVLGTLPIQRQGSSPTTPFPVHQAITTQLRAPMTRKRTMSSKKAPTDEELLAQFNDLGAQPASKPAKTVASRQSKQTSISGQSEQDLLAELDNLATQRPASRPGTPSLKSSVIQSGNRSPKRSSTATPPPGGRSSEEKSVSGIGGAQRKSGDSARSFHQSQTVFTPATTTTEESPEPEPVPAPAPASSGGGWWGGLLSTATAAVSQAQAAVKDLQKNEEAQKWAEQVRGNVGALRGFGEHYPRLFNGFY
jgi:hypothetical protein